MAEWQAKLVVSPVNCVSVAGSIVVAGELRCRPGLVTMEAAMAAHAKRIVDSDGQDVAVAL